MNINTSSALFWMIKEKFADGRTKVTSIVAYQMIILYNMELTHKQNTISAGHSACIPPVIIIIFTNV